MATVNINTVQSYMNAGLNMLLSGPAGVGKTAMLKEASSNLGLKMKYYSTATLDPYTDLVGIPVPDKDNKTVEYFRPKLIDEANVIFFDELNRADPKTQDTVFEIIQFRSINGEKLPNLKMVVAAINPNDGNYKVDDLDPALLDRFDVYLTINPRIDVPYFKKRFGADATKVVSTFWNEYERSRNSKSRNVKNSMAYISPRRMEKVVDSFFKIPQHSTIADTLPPGVNISTRELYDGLIGIADPKKAKNLSKSRPAKDNNAELHAILSSEDKARHKIIRERAKKLYESNTLTNQEKSKLTSFFASVLHHGVSGDRMFQDWYFVMKEMTPSDIKIMSAGWAASKKYQFMTAQSKTGKKLSASI